jgi:hypothetical protein
MDGQDCQTGRSNGYEQLISVRPPMGGIIYNVRFRQFGLGFDVAQWLYCIKK